MPDAGPGKIAFSPFRHRVFETMVLDDLPGYRGFDPRFDFLFNIYYSIGARTPRPDAHAHAPVAEDNERSISRPCRPAAIASSVQPGDPACGRNLIELGLTTNSSIRSWCSPNPHLFAQNPLRPAYKDPGPLAGQQNRQALPIGPSMAACGDRTRGATLPSITRAAPPCSSTISVPNVSPPTASRWSSWPTAAMQSLAVALGGWSNVQGWGAPLYWEEQEVAIGR